MHGAVISRANCVTQFPKRKTKKKLKIVHKQILIDFAVIVVVVVIVVTHKHHPEGAHEVYKYEIFTQMSFHSKLYCVACNVCRLQQIQ